MTATLYRVSQGRSFVSGVDPLGRPHRWCRKDEAVLLPRGEAEAAAQRLAEYLRDYPTAGRKIAASVRVHPATGGVTHWRPKL